jgi:hypothetical protein
MNDASAIFASLDRFIQRLADRGELICGHRVVTEDEPMATINSLKSEGADHSGHFDHAKQETSVVADRERCNTATESPGAGLARKVSYVDGYSGQNGQCIPYQRVTGGHPELVGGHSGNSPSDQEITSDFGSTGGQTDRVRASRTDPCGSDPTWWRDHYKERSRHWEPRGRRSLREAERIAWGELQWRWHKDHGERVPPGICGGCRKPIAMTKTIPLIDGTRIHDVEGHECLISYGRRWRNAATAGLRALGLDPPAAFERP